MTGHLQIRKNNRRLHSRWNANNPDEDVICFIDGDNAKVVVKTNEELTQEKMVEIQDIVMNVSKVYDVDIEKK